MKTVIDTTKFDRALFALTKRALELEDLVIELKANTFYIKKILEEAKKMEGGEENE